VATFGALIGTSAPTAGSNPFTFTTTAAVPAGGFVEIEVANFGLTTAQAGTLAATVAGTACAVNSRISTNSTWSQAILSVTAPGGGFSSGATVSISWSAVPTFNMSSAWYWTGVGAFDAQTARTTTLASGLWSTASFSTILAGHLVGAAMRGSSSLTATPAAGYTEINDYQEANSNSAHHSVYLTAGSSAATSYTPGGTWTGTGTYWAAAANYSDSAVADPVPPFLVMAPYT
jgi:hypothetical protein